MTQLHPFTSLLCYPKYSGVHHLSTKSGFRGFNPNSQDLSLIVSHFNQSLKSIKFLEKLSFYNSGRGIFHVILSKLNEVLWVDLVKPSLDTSSHFLQFLDRRVKCGMLMIIRLNDTEARIMVQRRHIVGLSPWMKT